MYCNAFPYLLVNGDYLGGLKPSGTKSSSPSSISSSGVEMSSGGPLSPLIVSSSTVSLSVLASLPLPYPPVLLQGPTRNQQQQQLQKQPVQSPTATATMSNSTGSKIYSLCPDMLVFFNDSNMGHMDTDPVPLFCQENCIKTILDFGLLSDD